MPVPMPKFQKQITGREEKSPKSKLIAEDFSGSLVMPGFQPIQRLATKVEKKNKIVEDSFDQSKHLLGVTSLKSITRPNFSGIGSVISPSSYHEQQDNDSN